MFSTPICVFALATLAASTATSKLAHREHLDTSDRTHLLRGKISNHGSNCEAKSGVICRKNGVGAVERQSENGNWARSLQFGDECATESTVVCKKNSTNCDICAACPCDVDTSAGLSVPYMQLMFDQLGKTCSQADSKVLLLGLGGGELSQYLLHQCEGMHVDAVELNREVISMARAYFGLGESEEKFKGRIAVEQADALSAVRERMANYGETYDAVFVDCFSGGGEVPQSCRSREMAEKVKSILKPGGVLLQNIWHYSKMREQVRQEFEDTKTIYRDVFDGALDDLPVPMPPKIRWVDLLRATKKEDMQATIQSLKKQMDSVRSDLTH